MSKFERLDSPIWNELAGTYAYAAGTNGTVTLPAGARVLQIVVHASAGGATLAILGGSNIPIINAAPPTVIRFNHTLVYANNTQNTIVFTSTDSYYVEFIRGAN